MIIMKIKLIVSILFDILSQGRKTRKLLKYHLKTPIPKIETNKPHTTQCC